MHSRETEARVQMQPVQKSTGRLGGAASRQKCSGELESPTYHFSFSFIIYLEKSLIYTFIKVVIENIDL